MTIDEVRKNCYVDCTGIEIKGVYKPIINGSMLSIGNKLSKTELKADQHFNYLQKLMWKWCFGVKVEDYSEE